MKELWHRQVRLLLFVLLLLAVLLLVLGILFADSSTKILGLYAWSGFISCMVLIVIALLIGKVIKRKDNYYDN